MSFNYQGIANTSAVVLAQFGKPITLRQVPSGTYNPATGTNTTVATDVTRKGAMFDFRPGETNGPGGMILQGDKKLIMEAGVVPSVQHRIIDGDDDWGVMGVGVVSPANTPVVYILHLRK